MSARLLQAVSGAVQPPTCLPIRSLSLGIGSGAAGAVPALSLARTPSTAGQDRLLQLHATAAQGQHPDLVPSVAARAPSASDSQHEEPRTPVMRPTAQRARPGTALPFALEAAGWSSPQRQQQQQQQGRLFQGSDSASGSAGKAPGTAAGALQHLTNGHAESRMAGQSSENGRSAEGTVAAIC